MSTCINNPLLLAKKLCFLCMLLCLISSNSLAQNSEDVTFRSSNLEISISGTLTFPENEAAKSAVVLLSVAGPTDRDLSLGTHKYYKELADGLANQGIASIRYDDRGVGNSEGEFLETSLQDRATDACKAMEYLQSEYPALESIGFIGMSEGAGLSVLATQICEPVSFAVLLSLPVREGKIEMKDQMNRLLATSFFTEEQKVGILEEANNFLEIASSTNSETKREDILGIMNGKYGSVILPPYQFVPQSPEEKTDFVLSPWYQSQLNYNIQTELRESEIPKLAIYGNLDQAIDPVANAELLRELSPKTSIIELEGINHLMQEATVGSPMEYAFLPTSFSLKVIEMISDWILEL